MFTARLTTEADKYLPYYSNSIMEAINTCPKWGLIRYKQRKYFRSNYRALALEAGSAMHDVFAALRLWQLYREQGLEDHFSFHGERLFGKMRMDTCFDKIEDKKDEALNFCFNILNSGDFYDDPRDKIRTMANMEETTIRYVNEMMKISDRNLIWVKDENDPTTPVGIEIVFDIVINEIFRFIGTIDGITVHRTGIRLEENKTASRIDEAFRESFRIKFQPTGYTLAGRLFVEENITDTKIIAVKVKQTRSHEDFVTFVESRDEDAFMDWYNTIMYTHNLALKYEGKELHSPMFTHSCNRYFRPCGFTDLCGASRADQQEMYEEMETTPLSPSEEAIVGVSK